MEVTDPGETIIQPELPLDSFPPGAYDDYRDGRYARRAVDYCIDQVDKQTALVDKHGRSIVKAAVKHELYNG